MSRAGLYNSAISSFLLLLLFLLPRLLRFTLRRLRPRHPSSILRVALRFSFRHYLFIVLRNILGYSRIVQKSKSSRIIHVHKWYRLIPRVDVFAENMLTRYWWENRSFETYNRCEIGVAASIAPRRKGEHQRAEKERLSLRQPPDTVENEELAWILVERLRKKRSVATEKSRHSSMSLRHRYIDIITAKFSNKKIMLKIIFSSPKALN